MPRRAVLLFRRLALLTGVVAAGVTLVAAPVAGQPTPQELKARLAGRALYVEHCAACHGTSARGNGPVAENLRRQPSDLTSFSRANGGIFPSERLRQVIDGRGVGAHGSVEMPVWGSVFKAAAGSEQAAQDRIEAILRFLESIQERVGQ